VRHGAVSRGGRVDGRRKGRALDRLNRRCAPAADEPVTDDGYPQCVGGVRVDDAVTLLRVNVLLVTHRYPPDGIGGVERYVEALNGELTKCGDHVTVLTRTPTHWPRRPQLRREEGLYRIVGSGVRLDQPFMHEQKLDRLTKRVLAAVSPDVVHVNHLIGLTPEVIPLAQAFGAATVLSLHDYYFACPLAHLQKVSGAACDGPAGGIECATTCFDYQANDGRWSVRESRFRTLLERADVVTAPSESVALYFEHHTAGAVTPVVLPYGTWTSVRTDTGRVRDSDELSLAILGTIAAHKGAHVVVEALRLAQLGPTRLALWGRVDDSDYERQLRTHAEAVPGLSLEFAGGYAPSQLGDALRDTDAVVVASQVREASPIVPREALAHGVPVLAARIGGLPESIDEGRNGLSFDPFDPAELAQILRRLASTPELVEALAQGARETEVRTAADNARELRALFVGALEARAA
jgi:glycosyltransferase involved in cell wall biosynthesis